MIINNLELQIEHLLATYGRLYGENATLRKKLIKITQERATLLDKNKKATNHIKRMLTQLKDVVA